MKCSYLDIVFIVGGLTNNLKGFKKILRKIKMNLSFINVKNTL